MLSVICFLYSIMLRLVYIFSRKLNACYIFIRLSFSALFVCAGWYVEGKLFVYVYVVVVVVVVVV